MAKASKNGTNTERTTPFDVSPEQSLGLAAAFRGIYHLFGGRVESWEITPDGVIAHNFSVNAPYDPEQILDHINRKDRRTQLYPTILWLNGMEPDTFTSPEEMTAWAVQYFKGSVKEGTSQSPKYVLDAMAAEKTRLGIGGRRGPKPKGTVQLKNIRGTVNLEVLQGVSDEDLAYLQNMIAQARGNGSESEESTPTAVGASS